MTYFTNGMLSRGSSIGRAHAYGAWCYRFNSDPNTHLKATRFTAKGRKVETHQGCTAQGSKDGARKRMSAVEFGSYCPVELPQLPVREGFYSPGERGIEDV